MVGEADRKHERRERDAVTCNSNRDVACHAHEPLGYQCAPILFILKWKFILVTWRKTKLNMLDTYNVI